MYITISIAIISFTGIIVMLFFRSWELKKGTMSHNMGHGRFDVFHIIHRTGHSVVDKGIWHGKYMISKIYSKLLNVIKTTNTKVGIDKIHDIVKGKNKISNENNNTASLYLKDITEHKNGVRERIEKGKEKIRIE